MSRVRFLWLALAILALVFAASAQAQQPKRGRGGGQGFGGFGGGGAQAGDLLNLVQSEGVRKELELESDQEKAIADLRAEMNKEQDEARRAIAAKYKEKLNKTLLPHQAERLQQISVQLRGNAALSDEDVAKKLGLSADQQNQIAEKRKDSQAKMRELFGGGGGGGGDFAERREKMQKLQAETNTAILGVLTDKQKEDFEKLKGKPIDREQLFPAPTPRRKQPDTE
jgi:hypothetical protein